MNNEPSARFKRSLEKLEQSGGGRIHPYLTPKAMKLLAKAAQRRPGRALGVVIEAALAALEKADAGGVRA